MNILLTITISIQVFDAEHSYFMFFWVVETKRRTSSFADVLEDGMNMDSAKNNHRHHTSYF